MDKYFLICSILIIFTSVIVIFARRQGIRDIENIKINPLADDFEILED